MTDKQLDEINEDGDFQHELAIMNDILIMKFENKANKLREQETLKTFANHFGLTFAKHPEYAHIDAALYNKGSLTGFAEVKGVHRSIEKSQVM